MKLASVLLVLLIGCSGAPPCDGCRDASGACQAGTQADACGAAGNSCSKCSGTDRCSSTQRTCAPCGLANCSGCCTSDGRCVVEVRDRDLYCGFDGAACVDCTASSKTCSTTTLGCQ